MTAGISAMTKHNVEIGGIKYILEDLDECELRSVKLMLLDKQANIKHQLEMAEADARTLNVYSDKDWYNRAKYARRITGIQLQAISSLEAVRRIKRNAEYQKSFNKIFVDMARSILTEDVFDMLVEKTNNERQRR